LDFGFWNYVNEIPKSKIRKGGEKMRRIQLLTPDDAGGGEAPEQPQAGDGDDQTALAHAVGRYRELVASAQGLVPEMVQGNTIEEVDASAEIARQAYATISRRIAEEHETRVPVGNPARSSADLVAANLKPEAKIALGLRKR
jgi:hypothetical protein